MVALIDDGFEESALDARQKAVIRYTDTFLGDPNGLTEELRAELRRHFTPEQIVELTAAIALFMGFSKISLALGPGIESMPITLMPTPE